MFRRSKFIGSESRLEVAWGQKLKIDRRLLATVIRFLVEVIKVFQNCLVMVAKSINLLKEVGVYTFNG